VIVTAAHCIYDTGDDSFACSATYNPGRNGTYLPYGSAEVTYFSIPTAYMTNPSEANDWAILIVNENVGSMTGYFGYGYSADPSGKSITAAGYPTTYQCTCTGIIHSLSSNRLLFNCDATSGESGGPLYDSYGIVWGLISSKYSSSYNVGPYITSYFYSCLDSQRAASIARW
jgi:glutamyl endopeptidase